MCYVIISNNFLRPIFSSTIRHNITNDYASQSESSSEDDYLTSEEEENKGDEYEEQEEDNNASETSESQQSSDVDETSLSFENEQSNDDTPFDVHTSQTLIQIHVLVKRVRKLIYVIRRSSILIEYFQQEKKQRIIW